MHLRLHLGGVTFKRLAVTNVSVGRLLPALSAALLQVKRNGFDASYL
jgi:hypothetical protein